jgi:hypothetical protein
MAIQVSGFYRNVPVKGLGTGERTGNRWFEGKLRMDYEFFFFTLNKLCTRRNTSVSQWLPDAYEEKISCFQKYFINLWRQHSCTVSQTGNADQTLVYFEMSLNTTVHMKGDKNVTVRTGGNEKQQCIVMLCIMADSRKLPPYIVLKRKTAKSECKTCNHPSPRIRLYGTRLWF